MSFDDPLYLECTCHQRALRADERVTYDIPRRLPDGRPVVETIIFAKDCPVHGYTRNENAEKS